jgi:protein prenyltransferase alpha subunit repeat containing protein 1
MFEYCYFDMYDYDYRAIRELIRAVMPNITLDTTRDIVQILVPTSNSDNVNEIRTKSFLYCMNLAASDIKLCEDLGRLYGESQAFENHRRFMLKFIVDSCRCAITNHVFCGSRKNLRTNCNQPLTKLAKYDLSNDSLFLTMLKEHEAIDGNPKHLKWCEIFLRFDFNVV